jgi:hypothetical protein
VAFQACLPNNLIKYLKQEFARNFKFRQGDIEIDIVTIVGEFHPDRWVSVVIPICSMPDRSDLKPDPTAFHNPMKIIQYLRLISSFEVVQVVEKDKCVAGEFNNRIEQPLKLNNLPMENVEC